jgi:hypothetical protein
VSGQHAPARQGPRLWGCSPRSPLVTVSSSFLQPCLATSLQDPANPDGTLLIQAGQDAVLVSYQTGLFCRLAIYNGNDTVTFSLQAQPSPSGLPPAKSSMGRQKRLSSWSTGAKPSRRPPPAPAAVSASVTGFRGRLLSAASRPPRLARAVEPASPPTALAGQALPRASRHARAPPRTSAAQGLPRASRRARPPPPIITARALPRVGRPARISGKAKVRCSSAVPPAIMAVTTRLLLLCSSALAYALVHGSPPHPCRRARRPPLWSYGA